MSHNRLRSVSNEFIIQLNNIEELYLNDNELKTIPTEIADLSRLTNLTLAGNPLSCACHEVWVPEVAGRMRQVISDFEAVKAFAAEIHSSAGSIDVVMNVAGISIWGSIENLEHRHWRRVVDVNLMGPIHVIECFIPPMIRAGKGGHLVNVSSAAGLFPGQVVVDPTGRPVVGLTFYDTVNVPSMPRRASLSPNSRRIRSWNWPSVSAITSCPSLP